MVAGLVVQVVGLILYQLILWVIPEPEKEIQNITAQPGMSFVEYQEPTQADLSSTKELSEEIVESKKQQDEINWTNAANPGADFSSRYSAQFAVTVGPDDYPASAARAGVGTVTVRAELLVLPSGRIGDVRILNVRFSNPVGEDYRTEFIAKARQILLTRTRLISAPYTENGKPAKFRWTRTIQFQLP
ncbi:MAG: hypothetical protein CMN76_08015 [Spirochaetaceae bacterium]|nr:hypothetical protein [Spirochaetaceae bacterium]|tara:strand:+ start:3783 stop:4346 length:564 start_codon:yes stop_codon:yes gene_type:complete